MNKFWSFATFNIYISEIIDLVHKENLMIIDLSEKTKSEIYHLMIQTIVPRPIAWVLSDNGNDSYNLAPFSYFNGICSDPPLISLSVGKKKDKSKKDTWKNIEERNEFNIHIASYDMYKDIASTAEPLAFGESEVNKYNLKLDKFDGEVRLPRLIGPKISLACTKHKIIELGNGPQGLIVGEIKKIFIDDQILDMNADKTKIDIVKLNPLCRLGGNDYAEASNFLTWS